MDLEHDGMKELERTEQEELEERRRQEELKIEDSLYNASYRSVS